MNMNASPEPASQLRTLISQLHKTMRSQTTEHGQFSLTELETLAHLIRQEKLLPNELAKLTRITPQSMSQILKKMEALGAIRRTPAKDDGRKYYISLTAKGQKTIERNRDERVQWLQQAMAEKLTKQEQQHLIRTIPLLEKLLG